MDTSNKQTKRRRYLPASELAMFCGQLAMILQSDILLSDGVASLCEEGARTGNAQAFGRLRDTVQETGSLYLAVKQAGFFPPYLVNMVRVGEQAGKLDEAMESLSRYYEREDQIRKSIRSAVVYPAVLMLMMAVVIAVLLIKVMPVFAQVFDDLGGQAVSTSNAMMRFGMTAGICALGLIGLAFVVVLALLMASRTQKGYRALIRLGSRFPLTKGIFAKLTSSRFASAMAMLLQSGMDVDESLELAQECVTDEAGRSKAARCRELMAQGVTFADALEQTEMFEPLYLHMVRTGSQTGREDMVMKKLGELCSGQADESLSRLVSVIEPTLVAVMSVIIGAILLAAMLPLTGAMSAIG